MRVTTAALSMVSRYTSWSLPTMHSARVVGMPRPCMASEHRYSRMLERSTARPSPLREYGVVPGALELNLPRFARLVLYLAQQDGAAVAQLRHVLAELVAGIEHRQRIAARQQTVADEMLGKIGARRFAVIEIDQLRRIGVEAHQIGLGQRRGRKTAVESLRQPRKAVLEIQLIEFFHGQMIIP